MSRSPIAPLRRLALVLAIWVATHAVTGVANADALEEVVVTAQKRSENVQDVPISIQAFSGDALKSMGVEQAAGFADISPNVSLNTRNATSPSFNIRGVGTTDFFGNAPGSVGLYVDEVTLSAPAWSGLALYDVEHVEVLRGPQNTLFGRNTTGGAINVISRKPSLSGDYDGNLSVAYGRFDAVDVEAASTIPIGRDVAVRFAGATARRDGPYDNLLDGEDFGDVERYSGRVSMLSSLTGSTELYANAYYSLDRSDPPPARKVGQNSATGPFVTPDGKPVVIPVPGAFLTDAQLTHSCASFLDDQLSFRQTYPCLNREGLNPSTADWHAVYVGGGSFARAEIIGGSLRLTHDFGPAQLTAITGYNETEQRYAEDNGGSGPILTETAVLNVDLSYDQFSEELRLASTDPDTPLRWIAGLYYFQEDTSASQNIRFGDNGSVLIGPPTLANYVAFSVADLDNEVWSAYGQVEYDLTPRFTLVAGLRYTDDKKEMPSIVRGVLDHSLLPHTTFLSRDTVTRLSAGASDCVPFTPTPPCTSTATDLSETYENVGGKLGVNFKVSDDLLAYASFSRGFKSGKFDIEFLRQIFGVPDFPVDEETLDQYELGFKSELSGGTLRLNGAVFHSAWEDQQTFAVIPGFAAVFVNVPESRIRGLELEAQWSAGDGWLLGAGVGYLDTEITDIGSLPSGIVATEGRELPFAPEWSSNLTIEKSLPIGSNDLVLQTELSYQSESKTGLIDRGPVDEFEDRLLINARASYTFGEGRYDLALYGENLSGEKYCNQKENLNGFPDTFVCFANLGFPTWGVSFDLNF